MNDSSSVSSILNLVYIRFNGLLAILGFAPDAVKKDITKYVTFWIDQALTSLLVTVCRQPGKRMITPKVSGMLIRTRLHNVPAMWISIPFLSKCNSTRLFTNCWTRPYSTSIEHESDGWEKLELGRIKH